jgi:hypothetical protein
MVTPDKEEFTGSKVLVEAGLLDGVTQGAAACSLVWERRSAGEATRL